MGRSSVSGLTVTVFGASGHIGRHLVNRFGRSGTQVIIPYRCDDYDIQPMKIMGDLGQIHLKRFHLKDYQSILDSVRYSDVVINCIGQDRRTLNFTIPEVNVTGAADIARACRETKVSRLIHVSSLRAAPDAASELSRSKYIGEQRVLEEFPDAIVVRPSTIFGPQDRLINGIGQFTRMWLGFPVVDEGRNIVRPIHIANVADAINLLSKSDKISHSSYDLVGPKAYTYRHLVELFSYAAVAPCNIVSLSPRIFWLYGKIFPEFRRTPFPLDTILQLAENEIAVKGRPGMADLGFTRLETLEQHMIEIARRYRRTIDYGLPVNFPSELLKPSVS